MTPGQLARRFATVSGWTLLSRILGLIRDRYAGSLFGDSLALSAFYSAFQLPNLMRNLLGEGALSLAFLPRYTRLHERRPAVAAAFAGRVLSRLAVLLAVLTMAGSALATAVLYWGGGRWALVAALALPQIPYLWLSCMSAQLGGMLNAHGRFAIPVAMAVVFNCIFLTALWLGQSVSWLPWAVLTAGLVTCAIHLLAVWSVGVRIVPRWRADQRYRDLRQALGPTILAGGAQQIGVAMESFLALWLVVPIYGGAVTVLFFANRLLQFPTALVGNATNVAVYPELARAHVHGGTAAQVPLLRAACHQLSWWLVPASVGLILVADPSVRVIYQTGAFGDLAVQRTVLCTQLLALGLLPLAVGRLLVRAVHAGGDAAAPLRLAGAVLLVQLVLGLALVVSPLAEAGLALAGALSNVAMMTGAIWLVRRRGGVGLIPWRVLAGLVVAAGVMTIAVLMAQAGLRRASADAFLGLHVWSPWWLNFAELVVSLVAGGGSYLLVTRLLSVRRKSAIQDRP